MNLNDLALLQKYFDYTDILNSKESEELNRTELNKKTNDEKKAIRKIIKDVKNTKLNYIFKIKFLENSHFIPNRSVLPLIFLSLKNISYPSKINGLKDKEQPIVCLKELNSSQIRLLSDEEKEFLLSLYDEFVNIIINKIEYSKDLQKFMDKEKINNLKDSTTISSSRILMGNLIYNVFSDFNKTTLLSIFKPNNDSSFLFNEEVNDAYDYELNNKSKVLKDKIFINPLIYLENEVDRINDELNVQQREFDEKYDLLSQQLRFKYSKKEVIFQINKFLKNQNFDDEIDDKIELELVILAENIYYHLNNILICYLSPTNDPRIGEDYLEYLSNDTKNPYYTYKHIYTIVEQFLKSIFLAPLQQAYEIEISTTESIKKLIDLLLKLENNDIITNSSACLLSWIDLQKDADN